MKSRRLALLLLLAVLIVLPVAVRLSMPLMARRLIHSDPLAQADAIVVLGSYRLERTIEAGTLFREGWSRRILLMHQPDVRSKGIMARFSIQVPLFLDVQRSALMQMSVPQTAIDVPVATQSNTRAEAEFTADHARSAGFKRIIVVTSPYHTGRAARFFRTASRGSFEVVMRPNRYERVDPDHWWRHPIERSDVVLEYLKNVHALTFPDD